MNNNNELNELNELLEYLDKREISQFLDSLAEGILPLSDWVKNKTYKPPDADLPWRSAPPCDTLHPSQLGYLCFLKGLINESSVDEEIKAYFSTRAENPLALAPHDDVAAWRELRGLSPSPTFGVAESDNLLMDVTGRPISRFAFYRMYLPLFVYAARMATSPEGTGVVDWKGFAKDLLANKSEFWPKSLPRRSSVFIKQFGRDLLYAVLGMRNQVQEPLRHAVLIELGEHRRVGNKFTLEEVSDVLTEFKKKFDDLFEGKTTLSSEQCQAIRSGFLDCMLTPVGSPPVTPRTQQV